MQEKLTKIRIQQLKISQQYSYSPKMLEEIVLFGKDISAHQESASSLNIICSEKHQGVGLYHLASSWAS